MPRCSRVASLVVLTIGAVFAARPAQALLPKPRVQGIFPPGVRAGGTADVTLRGTDLEGVNTLWFDHPGLRAFHLKGMTFRVACAPGTPVGHHDVRAVGTFGVSNPRTLVVGERPETLEVEPNNTPSQSTPIVQNSVVYGELAATDLDHFAFEGKAGNRVFLDLEGERVESRLDATLRVFDPAGREIAQSRDVFRIDPFLDLTLPVDGRYVVKVHDVVYGGSTEHTYRLTLHDGPHLDAIVPTIAAPGVSTRFTLLGRNLGGTPAPGLSIDGLPVEQREVVFTMPGTLEPDPTLPTLGFLPSSAASRRGLEFSLPGPSGPSNPVFIAEAVDPILLDREPNDAEHPQDITLPCDISGSFATPNDTDVYRFPGRKGDIWWVEVAAERIGSPADPSFLVQKVVEKSAPQDLVVGEDLPDLKGTSRFHMATLDAAVRWQVPEDGVYQVVVSDLYGSQRGDPRLSYRLNVRPERPDFQLFVVPDDVRAIDSLTVRAGGRASAYVVARRSDGFTGPIFVEARDLPPGVRCDPIVVAAGQAFAPLVFEADADAKPVVGTALLVGRARRGDRKEDLAYVAGATPLGPDRTHPALAGGMIRAPAAAAAAAVAGAVAVVPARVLRGFVLAVLEAAPLALSATPRTRVVAQGHQFHLDVSVTRRAGFVEPVVITASDIPANLTNASLTIAKEATTGVLPLFVAKTVAPGSYTFVLRGSGDYPYNTDPNAKKKTRETRLTEPSNPITLIVRPAPVSLAVNAKGGALKRGGQIEVDVTITRQNGFADGVTLTLTAPAPAKLSAAPATIPAGQTTARLSVLAAGDSPDGAAASVAVRAIGVVRGEPVEVDEPMVLTISK